MATYRELIYSVLDRIKAISDDSIITEDHVIFTIDKVRAALLYQKYGEVKREVIELLDIMFRFRIGYKF